MEPIEMAALGRSLYPGTLYDCRRDSFIPGVTLWDKASLTQDLGVHPQPNTDLKFSASDSLSEKASLMNVSTSLKASFLGGLVEVGGSAKYLRDQKTSAHQSRVTLQYSQTTRYEHLTMIQLGKITYPEVFEEKTATHVVTAVLYGAQVFMVFDKTFSEDEDKQEVDGNLNVMVKKIPLLSIEGEGDLKMNDKEKELAEHISCTFYGDCVLEENPTTYMEALQLYKKLPSLLRQTENDAVPVKVWLYPLALLNKKAATLEREIGATLISKVETVLEELGDVERKCNDLVKNRTVSSFQDLRERLQIFQQSFGEYKVLFQKALCRLLPAIRSGEVNEQALTDILLIHGKSLFQANMLRKWLENVQCEIDLLNFYTRELSDVPVVTSSGQFSSILLNPNVDTVVCFSFTSLKYDDPYLLAITEFLRVNEFEKLSAVPKSSDQDIQAWFSNPEISERMRENLFLFKSFSEANKDKNKTRFIIASVSDSTNSGTSIHLYRKGKMVDSSFQPVSKPPAPSIDVQDRNVILKLQKSSTGLTVWYRVEHKAAQPDVSGVDAEGWEFTDTPDAQETFTLTGLQLANQYRVRYRAVSDVGVSEASDSVLFSVQCKVSDITTSFCNEVRNKIMTSLITSRWNLSTIRSEVTHRVSGIGTPYVVAIPEGLKPGIAFFFQGVVHPDGRGFEINLKTGPMDGDDVAFHFNPHFCEECSVVCDSFRNGRWENPEETPEGPFSKGGAFDICMAINPEGYEVIVNGHRFCAFSHCIPLKKVSVLNISGDVFMNTFGIIEVDHINKKVIIPAHF
ncbi:verrucotoxin subunit beta-like [Colossoma macropomum]|uniref:verrucotoxin subunit beta-like n=1 Tax=Colossoma macropomum TaxID=42526 RepID=UPI0018646DD3|nr:verrucotoxin subunit beta-like [Colossoma macropomum]